MNWGATHWFNSGMDKIKKRCILADNISTEWKHARKFMKVWSHTTMGSPLATFFSALLVRSAIVMVDNSPQHACVSLSAQIAVSLLWEVIGINLHKLHFPAIITPLKTHHVFSFIRHHWNELDRLGLSKLLLTFGGKQFWKEFKRKQKLFSSS